MNVGYNRVKLVVDDLFNFSRNIPRIVRRLDATAGETIGSTIFPPRDVSKSKVEKADIRDLSRDYSVWNIRDTSIKLANYSISIGFYYK